jgi:hypothetical protein
MEVDIRDADLVLTVRASRDIFDIQPGTSVHAERRDTNTFAVDHPFLERVRFIKSPTGEVEILLNPGHWQQRGTNSKSPML